MEGILKLVTGIVTEPITVDDVKDQLRIDLATEDDFIADLITAAREYGEDYTGHAFATQTWDYYLPDFPHVDYIDLPLTPLQSVTSVKYKDSAGSETTMTVTTQYIVDADSQPGKIFLPYGKSWPSFTPYPHNAVTVRMVCGYSGVVPYVIPQNYKQAMLLHVGLMNKYRDTDIPEAAAKTVHNLYNLRRVRWW